MRLFLFLFLLSVTIRAQAQKDTIHLHFATARAVLTEGVKDQIDGYIYKDVLHNHQAIQIIGYTDYVGGNAYNDQLSRQRALAAKRYLMSYGFSDKDITICIGKGKIEREGMSGREGYAHDRRVDIVPNALPPTADPAPEAHPATAAITPAGRPVASTVDITAIKPNETFVLDKIYFYPGRHVVREESAPALDHLYQMLAKHPTVKIRIEGHVCCIRPTAPDALDEDDGGLVLSVNRARFIYDYLIRRGIAPPRLAYVGFGRRKPIVESEATEEDADKNRRVEVRILGN